MLNILRYKSEKIIKGALNMNIKRKILIKLNRINNLEVEHKNLSLPFYHGQHNSFLSNISLVPVISSAYQLPPKNNMNSISINCHELNKYYYLNLPDNNIYSLDNLITILKQHPDIEYVQTVPIQPIEPPNITPDFTQYQQYLYEPEKTVNINKIIGLGVLGAWKQEAYGQGVQVADIEWDFNLSHHDLSTDNITSLLPFNEKTSQADHGTAVAGLIMGKKMVRGSLDLRINSICFTPSLN